MAQQYYLRNIRKLLENGFSDKELRHLCFDEPTFRPVYQQLATVTGKVDIVQLLLEYAESKSLLDELLAWAKSENLAKYEEFQPYTDAPTDVPLPQAVREAVTALNKPLQTERLAAVESLAALVAKYPIAQDKLAEAVQQADYPDVRIHAAFMLVQFKDARAVPGLVEVLRGKKDLISESNLKVLQQIEDSDRLWPNWPLQPTRNASIWYGAIWALGQIGHAAAIPTLKYLLTNKNSEMHQIVIWALGRIGDAEALPDLNRILRSAERDTCHEAARAMARIGTSAIPNLLEALNDDLPEVRKAAANGLGYMKNNVAVQSLLNTMHNDPDMDVKEKAIRALGRIRDATVVSSLVEFLHNLGLVHNSRVISGYTTSEMAVVDAIKFALESIGTPEAFAALNKNSELQDPFRQNIPQRPTLDRPPGSR